MVAVVSWEAILAASVSPMRLALIIDTVTYNIAELRNNLPKLITSRMSLFPSSQTSSPIIRDVSAFSLAERA